MSLALSPRITAIFLVIVGFAVPSLAAAPPKVVDLRVQEVHGTTYFRVRLQRPADLAEPNTRSEDSIFGRDFAETDPMLRPQLVPQDGKVQAVYFRTRLEEDMRRRGMRSGVVATQVGGGATGEPGELVGKAVGSPATPGGKGEKKAESQLAEEPAFDGLEFVGKLSGKKEATFLLIYLRDAETNPSRKGKLGTRLSRFLQEKHGAAGIAQLLQEKRLWAEEPLILNFSEAKSLPVPEGGFQRNAERSPRPDDLEGRWAEAQATFFALMEEGTPEFGFYSFAREATSRLYQVPAPSLRWGWNRGPDIGRPGESTRRLYEVTTGASAITESLALERLRDPKFRRDAEERSIPIEKVRGIDIDEHPWRKMMGDKRPEPETLARLVPHDNYYVHFKSIAKFLEAGDLLDQWGTTLLRAVEPNSKDHRLKQRLEQQLCLKSTGLARLFGPAVVKSIAVTGSDPYLREGTDVTILFNLANKDLFQAGVAPVLAEARKKYAGRMREERATHEQVDFESFVTPLREVSLYRAYLGDVAVYSNSRAALLRIIDVAKGKLKPLTDSLDYQYMRTVFRLDDPAEDGFVFLSDPFIRNLVGPALRIKERRRLEALTSLQMVMDGALFTAWQTGRLPQHHEGLLAATGLTPGLLFAPDGDAVIWDGEHKTAFSNNYNTLQFATPLIELPISHVTPAESREYEQFRLQYMGLWRQFFDPIGMRLALRGGEVRWETYILPLVRNTQYNELRRITGEQTIKIDPAVFGDKTLLQFLIRLSPNWMQAGPGFFDIADPWLMDLGVRSWLGDWFTVRLDDSAVYAKLLESYIRQQIDPQRRHDFTEDLELVFQMPLTFGMEIRNPMIFAGLLTSVRKMMENSLPGALDWGPLEPYKGVSIVRVKARPEGEVARLIVNPQARRRLEPAVYYAMIDGAFYFGLREEPLKDLIDRREARKESGEKATPQVEVSSSLYLGPKAAVQAKDLVQLYLGWEAHRRALLSDRLMYALYRSRVVSPADTSDAVEAAALQYLGFVPVSPDGAPFHYDAKKDEVVNQRHGSVRQPRFQLGGEASSPAERLLLEQLATMRADLRFREDGIHTTLTLRKNAK
jgi:hypothetical protein